MDNFLDYSIIGMSKIAHGIIDYKNVGAFMDNIMRDPMNIIDRLSG
jgi:hypothetical protein